MITYPHGKYRIVTTKKFRRDIVRLEKSGFDMQKLQQMIDLLATDAALLPIHRNHHLKGDWLEYDECHIESDWVLIYQRRTDILILALSRTGTHAQLFGK